MVGLREDQSGISTISDKTGRCSNIVALSVNDASGSANPGDVSGNPRTSAQPLPAHLLDHDSGQSMPFVEIDHFAEHDL